MVVTHGAECIGLAVEGNFWFNTACDWGGMTKPFLTAVWRDLVLLKWRVYLGLLASYVPVGTDLHLTTLAAKLVLG